MPNPRITLEGRLGADPELRFTPQGHAVADFRMVTEDREKDGENWVGKDPSWWRITVWRSQAENVAETLRKGDLVLVHGKIKMREWEDREGNKRTSYDVEADTVAPSLRWNAAAVTRTERRTEKADERDPWATGGGGDRTGDVPPW